MYKKVKLSILSIIIALCTFAPSTFAAGGSELENKEVIIFEAQEIKDNNALLSRAKEGVTDNLEIEDTDYRKLIRERDLEYLKKKYMKLTKEELVKKLIHAELYIVENNKKWVTNHFEKFQ
ncbi:hypothetical protein EXW58_21630 [Bacillus mycoides]|uniref:hypothetical protein n=1 Tax=Bacillus mycoides TaxID=1405 RepID=UPI001C00BEC2|nr:hypothetical protein [Bacillus mycoides]QWG30027.1 hypothetical protein EXW58_21630 [Bacillus mycoides]